MLGLPQLWFHREKNSEDATAIVSQSGERWGCHCCDVTERGTLELRPLWCHTEGSNGIVTAVVSERGDMVLPQLWCHSVGNTVAATPVVSQLSLELLWYQREGNVGVAAAVVSQTWEHCQTFLVLCPLQCCSYVTLQFLLGTLSHCTASWGHCHTAKTHGTIGAL